VTSTPRGEASIDFADPAAVQALNGVAYWEIPAGYLCPPIPGRADYIHHVADLLAPRKGAEVRVLDVGVGANCIYPIIGRAEYGWRFAGSDVDPAALASAKTIAESNPGLTGAVELRLQAMPEKILEGIVRDGDFFDAVICNPPFHASREESEAGSRRKWKNLARGDSVKKNFGGQSGELWFPGGEGAFVRRMIEESVGFKKNVLWFTALISKSENLPGVEKALKRAGVFESRVIAMAQGQKKSRIVAWTFDARNGKSGAGPAW
jgi:23S rRNA (adenine1618-N6)-methyltransferase